MSVWEALYSIGRLAHWRRQGSLDARLGDLVDELLDDRVMDLTCADAQACAKAKADWRLRGDPLDDHVPDALLAAAAFTRGPLFAMMSACGSRNARVESVDRWSVRQR